MTRAQLLRPWTAARRAAEIEELLRIMRTAGRDPLAADRFRFRLHRIPTDQFSPIAREVLTRALIEGLGEQAPAGERPA